MSGPGPNGKVYVVAMCGAGDRPIAALGGRTPLEAAATEHLDALAQRGAQAAIRVIDDTVPPESDSGAMALLGYDPLRFYTGRGPLEGFGMGFLSPGDNAVAFRINFACLDPRTGRLDRRTARDLAEDELQALVGEVRDGVVLTGGVTFEVTAFARHRGILCLRGGSAPLGAEVSNTDPGFSRVGPFGVPNPAPAERPLACEPLDGSEAAAATASAVNEFVARAGRVLAASEVNRRRVEAGRLPANTVLVRDGGTALPSLPSYREAFGSGVAIYGQIPAERGLAMLIGADWNRARQEEGQAADGFYRDVARRMAADPAEVVFAHLKGPDEPGHDGRPADKVRAVEEIDRFFVSELVAALDPRDTCVVTADHATPCEAGIHTADPVPALAVGPGVRPDGTGRLGEREAATGSLPVRRAVELMPLLTGRPGPR